MSAVNPSNVLELDTKKFFRSLNRAMSVLHIATVGGLQTCNVNDSVNVIKGEEYKEFDYIVVYDEANVVGLLEKRTALNAGNKLVSEIFDPISERNLISEEAGVLEFLLKANNSPARLVLSGDKIKGIVTIADLQKLPVRAAVYAMIMHMELLMTDVLRHLYQGGENIIDMIRSTKRRGKCQKKFENLTKNNLCIDQFGALDFCDKRDLLSQSSNKVGLSKRIIENELKMIEKARNSLAHGGDYALEQKTTTEFINGARKCEKWINRLIEILVIFHTSTLALPSENENIEQDRRAQWEEELFQQIIQYLDNPDQLFFCRLNFLCTDKGKIYVLDTEKWWHTLSGEVSYVRERLQNLNDQLLDLVRVRKSSRGWIAYFARTRLEENGVGWNDKGLIIETDDKNLQRRARSAQKAYLEWAPERLLKTR